MKEDPIAPVKTIQDHVFSHPTVITVKTDRCRNCFRFTALNAAIQKDKYPIPNLENVSDQLAEILNSGPCEAWFSTLDLQHAYGQIPATPRHCQSLQLPNHWGGGRGESLLVPIASKRGSTDYNAHRNSKNHVTVIPPAGNIFAFIEDILVVTRGSHEQHMQKVQDVLQILSKARFRVEAEKCNFEGHETEWLRFKLTSDENNPHQDNVQGISDS